MKIIVQLFVVKAAKYIQILAIIFYSFCLKKNIGMRHQITKNMIKHYIMLFLRPSPAVGDKTEHGKTSLKGYWCPPIYFNHQCYSASFLRKQRLEALPQFIGWYLQQRSCSIFVCTSLNKLCSIFPNFDGHKDQIRNYR